VSQILLAKIADSHARWCNKFAYTRELLFKHVYGSEFLNVSL